MNDTRGGQILALLIGMCMILYGVFSVMLTQGNSISEMCFLLMVGGFLLCLVSPRIGFVLWIVSSGYMDLIKRLTVMSGNVTQLDLYYILGVHPLMLCGLCLSVMGGALLGRHPLTRRDLHRLFAAGAGMVVVALMAARERGLRPSTILSEVANNGLYSLLLFVLPFLLPDLAAVLRTLRLLVIVYAPVAVYGIIQQTVGFQDFEVEYLLTGLSIEVKQIIANEVRAFSTLNSPTALGFASGACLIALWTVAGHRDMKAARVGFSRLLALVLTPVFVAALACSTVRSAFVLMPVGLMATWLFHGRLRLRLFYAGVAVFFVTLVLSSGWLLEKMPAAMNKMAEMAGGNTFAEQMLRVGTYTERLVGFSQVLANPRAYSLLGFGPDRGGQDDPEFYNHDPLSTLLVRYGVLALLAVLFTGALLLRHFHACVWRLKNPAEHRVASLLLAVPLGFLVASLIQGSVFGTFPLNLLTFLFLGMVESLALHGSRGQAVAGPAPLPASSPAPARPVRTEPLPHPALSHRFRRTRPAPSSHVVR